MSARSRTVTAKVSHYSVVASIDDLMGGWYAYVEVFDDHDDYQGYDVTGTFRKDLYHDQRPKSWGFRTKAEALKARTELKNAGIEMVRQFLTEKA